MRSTLAGALLASAVQEAYGSSPLPSGDGSCPARQSHAVRSGSLGSPGRQVRRRGSGRYQRLRPAVRRKARGSCKGPFGRACLGRRPGTRGPTRRAPQRRPDRGGLRSASMLRQEARRRHARRPARSSEPAGTKHLWQRKPGSPQDFRAPMRFAEAVHHHTRRCRPRHPVRCHQG